MNRIAFTFVLVLVLLFASVGSASAQRISPAQLQEAGWTCFNVPGLGVHCTPPGVELGVSLSVPVLYFDTTDVNSTNAPFLGTEILIHHSIYNGQPCPQEGLATYASIGGLYYACHRR